uniref:Uncharacterized protein n=1 Tax=Trichobilharzia regenti TaxID=157069 RepID=A0AA85KGW2_TRIRE|nr:unnamed protein product [Trichobilharzia regenti]
MYTRFPVVLCSLFVILVRPNLSVSYYESELVELKKLNDYIPVAVTNMTNLARKCRMLLCYIETMYNIGSDGGTSQCDLTRKPVSLPDEYLMEKINEINQGVQMLDEALHEIKLSRDTTGWPKNIIPTLGHPRNIFATLRLYGINAQVQKVLTLSCISGDSPQTRKLTPAESGVACDCFGKVYLAVNRSFGFNENFALDAAEFPTFWYDKIVQSVKQTGA